MDIFRLFNVDKLVGVDTGSAIFPGNIVTPVHRFAYKTLGYGGDQLL
jgi:hypothetical protein